MMKNTVQLVVSGEVTRIKLPSREANPISFVFDDINEFLVRSVNKGFIMVANPDNTIQPKIAQVPHYRAVLYSPPISGTNHMLTIPVTARSQTSAAPGRGLVIILNPPR